MQGQVSKMLVEASRPVTYLLPLGEERIPLNPYLGKTLKLKFTGQINCVACDRLIKKSYQQGYCFPCTQKLAQCDMCVMKPELCHYHKGTCREPKWGDSHCMVPHTVYLANSSGVKVGITRGTQVPTRWIDQGAVEALPIVRVQTRRQSGYLEVALAKHISDKTNWRKMLKGEIEPINLPEIRDMLFKDTQEEFKEILQLFGADNFEFLEHEDIFKIEYPVLQYPTKITSLGFDKTPEIEGTLLGIKGQYLIFDKGVLNIRKYGGYVLEI